MTARPAPGKRGASKAPRPRKKRSDLPGFIWLITGVALGFFAAFLMGLTPGAVDVRTVARQGSDTAAQKQEPENKPVFDFYTLLPESEVTLPATDPAEKLQTRNTSRKKPAAAAAGTPSESRHYLLQAGSFRNAKDAERLRAQLLLKNLSPKVEQVSVGGGEVWFRVQLGPFSDQKALGETRAILAENNIDSLLLQLK